MEIINYPDYLIYPNGKVFSKKTNKYLNVDNSGRYHRVWLYNNDGKKRFSNHLLVAIYYIPNPHNYPQVDHIDRNGKNNDISNLRWVSMIMNMHNRETQKNNKCGIKNLRFHGYSWCYKKVLNKITFEFYNKNKQLVLWVKFVHSLKIKRKLNL